MTPTGFNASWERRLSRLDGDTFLFGTAILFSLNPANRANRGGGEHTYYWQRFKFCLEVC